MREVFAAYFAAVAALPVIGATAWAWPVELTAFTPLALGWAGIAAFGPRERSAG